MEHSAVVELLRYASRPGEPSEAALVESQDALGIDVIGEFRDLDDPDVVTWVRAWRAANGAADAPHDVLLLRPARPDSAFVVPGTPDENASRGYVAAVILLLEPGSEDADIISFFELAIAPGLAATEASVLGYFVAAREGVNTFVFFVGCDDRLTLERVVDPQCRVSRTTAEAPGLARETDALRLEPTARSRLNGRSPACPAASRTASIGAA